VFGASAILPIDVEVDSSRRTNLKNKLTLCMALAAALTLSFLPNVYASGPELAFVTINQTGNWTDPICASDRPYQSDLVDRSWCGNWTEDGCPTGYQRDLLSRAWCE
jgi:hypothetical protein